MTIAALASVTLSSGAIEVAGAHATTIAAPLWEVGNSIKAYGIDFAVKLLLGGTALVAAGWYFIAKDKTAALKTLAIGVALCGLVYSLPTLGGMSRDTVGGLTGITSGGNR